jgi:hypothetical protein
MQITVRRETHPEHKISKNSTQRFSLELDAIFCQL